MASIETIRTFQLYDLTVEYETETPKLSGRVVPIRPHTKVTPTISDKFSTTSILDFPVIIKEDGVPWSDANLYLLEKLKNLHTPKPSTLGSIANDLSRFLYWLETSSVNYLEINQVRLKSPLYRYQRFLRDQLSIGALASSTAQRRMNTIIQFYRWLKLQRRIPNIKLWEESNRSVNYAGHAGAVSSRKVVVTDLTKSLRRTKQADRFSGTINDGGSLRPLERDELLAVRNTLDSIGNTEMALAFDFAVLTGARLGTVFTLRTENFSTPLSMIDHIPKIRIGGSYYVNNKMDKEMVLLIPPKLYQRIQTYLLGDRYLKRKALSQHQFDNKGASEYVFLTKSGRVYYHANHDENLGKYSATQKGNAITQFICGTLKPRLIRSGHDFPFKFHDLRATFGIGLLEWEIHTHKLSNWNRTTAPDYLYLLNYIRERMGHADMRTTEAYLTYKPNKQVIYDIQENFEDYLLGLHNGCTNEA